MMGVYPCPKCGTSLGEMGGAGRLDAVCARCRFRYEILRGRLVGQAQSSAWRSGAHERDYELRIALAPDVLETLAFSIRGSDDRLAITEGNVVVVAHTMRDGRREELLFVENATTGRRCELATPGAGSEDRAMGYSVLTALVVLMAFAPSGLAIPVGVVTSFAAGALAYMCLSRVMAPRHHLEPEEQAELEASRWLLERKRALEGQRARIELDEREKLALRARLTALQSKMRRVGIAAYEPRIATIDRALAMLDEQLALDRRLLEAYDRSVAMIEIEQETGALAGELDADVSAELHGKLAELRALEGVHAELSRQLEANAEVEQLLRRA